MAKLRCDRIGGALALILTLTSCGGSAGGGNTTTGTAGGTGTVTPTPTPTPTPLTTAELNAVVQPFLAVNLEAPDGYNLADAPALPAYYDGTVFALDNRPADDLIDNAIATVGRVLFYDPALSVNDTTSCATCHRQQFGFEDDERFSTGFAGTEFTAAHSMRLANLRFYQPGEMFWNRRAASVEDQATQPILNPVEMGWEDNGGLSALFAKLADLEYYPALFTWAFGDEAITQERVERALAHFERSMISSDSRWDRSYAQVFAPGQPGRGLNETLPGFSASENRGRELFMTPRGQGGAGCSACHLPPSYALAANSQGIGLDAGETEIFKAPSLKNVGRSQFFMHDGRFTSLMQVVEHYDSGVQAGPALDNRLRLPNGQPDRLNLSANDRQALVDFMPTLDDETLAADGRFSDPFR